MGYDAFISYSHAADDQLAPRLQDGLQRMAKPWWRRRSLHVFRDTTGLSANPGLWTSITTAMDGSAWFVLLASPEAAQSPWVERELSHWLTTRGPDQVLPVVTDGTWSWDPATNDFDVASTAVPAVLMGAFAEEPRHVDLSWARTEEQLDLRNGRFRDQVAEIAAPLHGVAKDDLEGSDVREHRRTLRWAWAAAIALLLFAAGSGVAGALAVRNADEAATAKAEAIVNAEKAAQNAAEADEQRTAADSNAAEAERQRSEAQANAAEADANATEAEQQRTAAEANAADAQEQGAAATASAAEANQQRATAESNAARAAAEAAEAQRQRGAAAASASIAAAAGQDAITQRDAATVAAARSEAAARAEVAAREAASREAQRAVAAEQATRQALTTERNLRDSVTVRSLAATSDDSFDNDGPLSLLLALEAQRRGASVSDTVGVGLSGEEPDVTGHATLARAVNQAAGGATYAHLDRYLNVHSVLPQGCQTPPQEIVMSADQTHAATSCSEGVVVWNVASGAVTSMIPEPGPRTSAWNTDIVGLSTSGDLITLRDLYCGPSFVMEHCTRVMDTNTGAEIARFNLGDGGTSFVSPDGAFVVVWHSEEETSSIQIFDLERRVISATYLDAAPSVNSAWEFDPFSPSGRWLLGSTGGVAVAWDLRVGGASQVQLATPNGWTANPIASSDDKWATVGTESGFEVFALETAQSVYRADGLFYVSWSHDGSRLVWNDGVGLNVLRLSDGAVQTSPVDDPSVIPQWSTNDRWILLGTDVIDPKDMSLLKRLPSQVLEVSPDGRIGLIGSLNFLTNSYTTNVQIRDLSTDQTLLVADSVETMSQDGRWALLGASGRGFILDMQQPAADLFGGPISPVVSQIPFVPSILNLSPDGRRLIGGSLGALAVWDLTRMGSGEAIAPVVNQFGTLAIFPDGPTALEFRELSGLQYRNLVSNETRPGPEWGPDERASDVGVSPDGRTVLVRTYNYNPQFGGSRVQVYDASSPVARGELTVDGEKLPRFSGDGTRVAVVEPTGPTASSESPGLARVFDVATLALVAEFPISDVDGGYGQVALNKTGDRLALTTFAETRMWDVNTGQQLWRSDLLRDPQGFTSGLRFSPDDRTIAELRTVLADGRAQNSLMLLSAETGSLVGDPTALGESTGGPDLVWSPDSTMVAVPGVTESSDGPVRNVTVHDGASGDMLLHLEGAQWTGLAFTPDSSSIEVAVGLFTGAWELRRYPVSVELLRSEACRLAGRNMTETEWNRWIGPEPLVAACPGE